MPIIIKEHNGDIKREHEGRVLKVRKHIASRNHSDTLDYSDFRDTEVTEAFVYLGRTYGGEPGTRIFVGKYGYVDAGSERPIEDRFVWVDCTNLLGGRGRRTAAVDELALLDGNLLEDYEAWEAHQEAELAATLKKRAEHAAQEKIRREAEERDRPVKGKPMVVFRGRKVPVGTRGVVAYVGPQGVLLKAPHEWRNRDANGIWVNGAYLRAE